MRGRRKDGGRGKRGRGKRCRGSLPSARRSSDFSPGNRFLMASPIRPHQGRLLVCLGSMSDWTKASSSALGGDGKSQTKFSSKRHNAGRPSTHARGPRRWPKEHGPFEAVRSEWDIHNPCARLAHSSWLHSFGYKAKLELSM